MKSIGSYLRFIAISATVPNSEDVATWLGRSQAFGKQPALHKVFDDSYRPVKLDKEIKGFVAASTHEFERVTNSK